MQAVVLNAVGAPLSNQQIARPVAAAGQVLVRVIASGVNPLDTKIAAGKADHARAQLPAVLGIDIAGIFESVGDGVQGYTRGDRVFGMTGGIGGVQGSLAQYAAVDAYLLAHVSARARRCWCTAAPAASDASFRAARQYGGHVVSCLGWGTHALAPLSFRAATYSGVFTLLALLAGKGRARQGGGAGGGSLIKA